MIFICELEGVELDKQVARFRGVKWNPNYRPSSIPNQCEILRIDEDIEVHAYSGRRDWFYALAWKNPVLRDDVIAECGPTAEIAVCRTYLTRLCGHTLLHERA